MSDIPPTAAEGANGLNPGPETPASPAIQTGKRLHRSSLGLALLSGLGLALSVLIGLGLFTLGVVDLTRSQAGEAAAGALISIGWVSVLVAVLQVPSLVLSIRRLRSGKAAPPEAPVWRGWLAATAALVLMIPLVALGGLLAPVSNTNSLLFLPPLQLLVVGVPIWWFFETGRRGLKGGAAQRGWGVVSFSTLITMPVVLIFELAAMIILGVVVLSFLAAQPQVLHELQNLFQTLSKGSVDPEVVSQLLAPYLKQPGFIFLVVVVGSALIPLLEEGLKPLALWTQGVAGRKITPSQGFTAGLICGAIFALLESLFSLSPAMGADWTGVVIGRMGTGLLHVTCSGLVGWGLALAWRREKYLHLGGLYLSAVFLHGSWNAISLLSGFSATIDPSQSGPIAFLGQYGNLILVFLVVVDLLVLLAANRYLRTHPELDDGPAALLGPAAPLYDPLASVPPSVSN